jgi:endonuclease YncB( thermonuclease family)
MVAIELGNRCSILLSYGTVLMRPGILLAYVPPRCRRIEALHLAPMRDWRERISAAVLAAACTVGCADSFALAQQQQSQISPSACGADEIARGTVSRITDGRTLTLDDGREVRLAAIEVLPLPQDSGAAPDRTATENARRARDALAALTEGDQVVLRRAEAAADRYGRLIAYAYTERDGDELFVQDELVASGLCPGRRPHRFPRLRQRPAKTRKCRSRNQAWPVGRSVL